MKVESHHKEDRESELNHRSRNSPIGSDHRPVNQLLDPCVTFDLYQ